jgi:two-component system, OmpR family, sensor histidine kinase KdpD
MANSLQDDFEQGSNLSSEKGAVGHQGKLKLFIGAAPGVGKTYTMLREAETLSEGGEDVVIGFVDTRDRPETLFQMGKLEIIPRKRIMYKGRVFEEVDLEAIIARHPKVIVIDELAHSNIEGSTFPKRYMDVEYILSHGIDVLTAVNVQHLEDVYKEAEKITGIAVREIIPTTFVERADEIEVVDVSPETIRQRLRDGVIYPQEKVEQALNHFFRKPNLSALRELALREVADNVDQRLQKSFERYKIPGPIGAKETILVCVNTRQDSSGWFVQRSTRLIRKGARIAKRMNADLYFLSILEESTEELSSKRKSQLNKMKLIAKLCDAEYMIEQRNERKIGDVIIEVAEKINATQIVIGQPTPPLHKVVFWRENPVNHLLRKMQYFDLQIVGWKEEQRFKGTEGRIGNRREWIKSHSNKIPGKLTIYVGAAPGVGKTYQILRDYNDARAKGTDVVIGLIETHGRQETAAQIGNLEVLQERKIVYEGRTYSELDVEGIHKRNPEIVLIDELAHTNVPGCEREKRYQDIIYLLSEGIHVVTAVNIQHLESLRDKVEHITGVRVRERVPDWFMDLAWQIRLIDVTPETLQQRLIDGKIYTIDKIEQALSHFFRLGNLSALREIALLEVADDVEQRLDQQRFKEKRNPNKDPNQSFDRILVCVNYRPHSEKLIRRGWRIADRHNAPLYVLAVISDGHMTDEEKNDLERIQGLSEQFEATFLKKHAKDKDVGEVIVQTAKELQVSQIVIGQPVPGTNRFYKIKRNPVDYVIEHAKFVNLHVVANSRE